ncbi:unnamed protein product [Musa acuminata var. zebrina]
MRRSDARLRYLEVRHRYTVSHDSLEAPNFRGQVLRAGLPDEVRQRQLCVRRGLRRQLLLCRHGRHRVLHLHQHR